MTANKVHSFEYTPDYAEAILLASLERTTKLRKDLRELREILDLDIRDEYLEDLTRDLVSKLLGDFSPESVETLLNGVRNGKLDLKLPTQENGKVAVHEE
jgi:hypothetical protein